MKFKDIINRLTGFSCPVFGVSWSPPEAEAAVARRVITALEDRRVLYVDSEMEVPAHCVDSVLRIRDLLTAEISPLPQAATLTKALRALRAACRKFLDSVGGDEGRIILFGGDRTHYASWRFNGALGILRGTFGIHVAQIAAAYGLDVEDDLASILPGLDDDDAAQLGAAADGPSGRS